MFLIAVFVCSQCGKCCHSLGRSIRVLRRLTSRDVSCRSLIHGEVFTARLEEGEVPPPPIYGGTPLPGGACPFLCQDAATGRSRCAVYATRPRICREFRCARYLITAGGAVAGQVRGRRSLSTGDARLTRIWEDEVSFVREERDDLWAERVSWILLERGYALEPLV